MTESRNETITFLEHHVQGANRRHVETHISIILLAGERAFKIKKPVKLPYADFSTPQLRLAACENELRLNRRTAPDLYLGVRRISRSAQGGLELDGPGELADAVVEMNRFDEAELFDRLAEQGTLETALMEETAIAIARFHENAEVLHKGGGAANLQAVLDINRAGFATSTLFSDEDITALDTALRQRLARHAGLLDAREREGRVRLCHGDLHLRNIYRTPHGPRLFDCIEFNDAIASTDVLYDLAFLLMDLKHRGLGDLASAAANRYLDRSGDDGGYCLLPFLMAIRAEVRAHVTATQAAQAREGAGDLAALAHQYYKLAKDLLIESQPRLIAIGGFSGSGKSTLAMALAPRAAIAPGARLLESDRLRKAMFGAQPNERLPAEAYSPEVSTRVYDALAEKAKTILKGGGTVIVDAVFDRPQDRAAIASVVEGMDISFTGFWLDAPPQVLRARISSRKQGDSDATTDILDKQLSRASGTMEWHKLNAASPSPELVAEVLRRTAADQPTSMYP